MTNRIRRFSTLALLALLLGSLAPGAAMALTPATGDPAATLYQTSRIVRIDLNTSTDLSAIGVEGYVDATFKLTMGSTVYGGTSGFGAWDIKMRLKGVGSYRSLPQKAALRLEFPNELQRAFGIKRMTLNNMIQDPSKVNEAIGYTLFREMGIAAPRTGYAEVWINGASYGLYLNVESIDKIALEKRSSGGGTTHLYEGRLGSEGNPLNANDAHYQVDVGSAINRADLQELIAASQAPASSWYARVSAAADLQQMTRYWAVDRYIGNWDGYTGASISNYYLHSDNDGRFQMLPWGVDQIFGGGVEKRAPYSFGQPIGGLLFTQCLVASTCRALYVQALRDVRDRASTLGLASTAATLHATLTPKIASDTKDETSPATSKAAQVAASGFILARPSKVNLWLAQLTRVTAPTISGTTAVGQVLSATSGAWSYGPTPKYSYQWFRCSTATQSASTTLPARCTIITGATKSLYTLKVADRGSYLRVRVTAVVPTSSLLWFSKPTVKVR